MSMPATPQERVSASYCSVGDFIPLACAPEGWDHTEHTVYKFRMPEHAPVDPLEPMTRMAVPVEEWIFSLKPYHDPANQRQIRVWQRIA